MSRIMVTSYVQARNAEARQRIIDLFKPICEHAWANEPGTLRYCICIPYEDDDGVSIYKIEEYTNKAAFETHKASKQARTLWAGLTNPKKPVFAAAPILYEDEVTLSTGDTITFTRPIVNDYPGAYIVLATVKYKPGLTTAALPGWKDMVNYGKENEALTLTYTVLESKKENVLRTVEAYESKEYARNVHIPAPAIKANQEQNGHMRDGPNAMTVKRGVKAVGFLGKSSLSKL